jgi:hypothetical protein
MAKRKNIYPTMGHKGRAAVKLLDACLDLGIYERAQLEQVFKAAGIEPQWISDITLNRHDFWQRYYTVVDKP